MKAFSRFVFEFESEKYNGLEVIFHLLNMVLLYVIIVALQDLYWKYTNFPNYFIIQFLNKYILKIPNINVYLKLNKHITNTDPYIQNVKVFASKRWSIKYFRKEKSMSTLVNILLD